MQTGWSEMKWSLVSLIPTCSSPDDDAPLACFVLPPVSVPHHVVLSPQLLYPSDSRQCVLRPPTWHSSQGPQGVCVRVCAFHYAAFVLILRAPIALHMLVLGSICLRLCFRLAWACCLFIYLSLFFSPACLPVTRLCIWDCFCTILDGLKQKLES